MQRYRRSAGTMALKHSHYGLEEVQMANKTYTVVKDGEELKELKSLAAAKKLVKGKTTDYQKIKAVCYGVADMLYYDYDWYYGIPGATREVYPIDVLHSK